MQKYVRRAKIPTQQSLENAALYYLGRFASSEKSLRRVLENKLRRALLHSPEFAADHAAQKTLRTAIDAIIAKHHKLGILNDATYAAMKTANLRRAGKSARVIRQKLAQKGIGENVARQALAGNEDEPDAEATELKAAREFARRRKLGPFRKKDADILMRKKELAAMARAGFGIDVARKALADFSENE